MSQQLPLLIELGCEELPVKALPGLAQALFDGILSGLDKRGVEFERDQARVLYTPRRLAVQIDAVASRQPDQAAEVLGPYLNIALDADGQPTRALQGFAAKAGIDWQTLERTTDSKGERFVHRSIKPGADTRELLAEITIEAVNALPIPKPMRWSDHDYAFIRPVQWLVLLFGTDVIDCELLGVRSGRQTRGHRFHAPAALDLASPEDYGPALHRAHVIVDPVVRRAAIAAMVEHAAAEAGGQARIDEGILDEVNCLVEWPVPITCSFESDFLRVPQEALILTMETNQKFFPVLDADERLTEHFIGVSNIESRDPAEIRKGYERVIRPRFADARFFYDEDRKQGLASMNEGLASVTYQAKLGTIADKVERVAQLAELIATQVGVDPALARRAAVLSKADLQSRMVNEFPELQGIAGRYYAYEDASLGDLDDTDRAKLALALDEVYMPRNAGDGIATSKLGQVLAIAERLDTLAGGFAAGLKPTGNKDPFALRRNALGLARTLIEVGFDVDLRWALQQAVGLVAHAGSVDIDELCTFAIERLRGYYEQRGEYDANRFEAVAAVEPSSLVDFDKRLRDLKSFAGSDDGQALAAANKRCGNLLRKAVESGESIPDSVVAGLFDNDAERALAEALAGAGTDTTAAFAQRDYVAVLARLAQLRPAVDAFFDSVMVMADDAAVRGNRLALLKQLQSQFLRIADIGRLASG
jgi:glycyl-tRNA synthetase beta chain